MLGVAFLLWERIQRDSLGNLAGERIWDVDEAGVRGLDVLHREAHDPYRTVGDLLDQLPEIDEPNRRLKALYQLHGALDFDAGTLRPDIDAIVGTEVLGEKIARVETIEPGTLVDRSTMRPLGPGSSVRQPLGVIAYDADDRVLAKAKVVT
jgi:hypothetical protein